MTRQGRASVALLIPIPSAFLARSLRAAIYARKRKFRAIPAVSRPAFEPMAKTPTNPPRLTDRATLTIENGVAALAAKGVVIVGGGRRQFGLTLAAALPPRLGKISHVVSLKKEGAACDKASDPGTS